MVPAQQPRREECGCDKSWTWSLGRGFLQMCCLVGYGRCVVVVVVSAMWFDALRKMAGNLRKVWKDWRWMGPIQFLHALGCFLPIQPTCWSLERGINQHRSTKRMWCDRYCIANLFWRCRYSLRMSQTTPWLDFRAAKGCTDFGVTRVSETHYMLWTQSGQRNVMAVAVVGKFHLLYLSIMGLVWSDQSWKSKEKQSKFAPSVANCHALEGFHVQMRWK